MLLLLTFQVLPVKELGRLLASGTLTEEIPVHGIDIKEVKVKPRCVALFTFGYADLDIGVKDDSKVFVQQKDQIPHFFIGDIFSPPPNA